MHAHGASKALCEFFCLRHCGSICITTSLSCLSWATAQFRLLKTIDLQTTPSLRWHCRSRPCSQGASVLGRHDHDNSTEHTLAGFVADES
jgi:hypothetical protein